ncbi:MAG: hypothetical protein ACK2U1_13590, partial [Anaerolineales bacterium]
MSDTNNSYKSFKQFRLWILMVLLLGFIVCITSRTKAQADNEPWTAPVNLSLSGAAIDPRIVIDSTGGLHVLWREDAANSFYYTHQVNGEWAKAIPVEGPFGTIRYLREELGDRFNEEMQTPLYNPELAATQDGRIHALWLDDDNNLYHSSVLTGDFANYDSWTSRELISDSVSTFSHAVDNAGSIYLVYVDKSELGGSPAGIYYRRWNGESGTWSEPVALYESAYFRGASSENLNLQIMVGKPPDDESKIYVVLDNRPLEDVMLIRSEDRGASWQQPIIVDQRELEDPISSVGPSNIKIISTGEQLHMVWLAGHTSNCQLYHQWSVDGGQTWQPASILETDFAGCPTNYWLLSGANNLFYLLALTTDGNYYLQAWNGEEWSQGEYQSPLTGFEDPNTLRDVLLDCHQFILDQDNNIVSVGCGSGVGNNDIWLIERHLGEKENWFPTETKTWSEPVSLVAIENSLLEPIIFSAGENLLHVFWISPGDEGEIDSNAIIYYMSWNGEEWSPEVPLIHLNSSQADELNGIYDPDIGLFLLWRNPETNAYYYSSVKSEDILLPAEWSTPAVFPKLNSEALFSAPAPILDDEGILNIVYAIPLNEDRGIYHIKAGEDHQTWSEPISIVDAVNANWAMVDKPSVAQTENGDIHAIFTVYSLRPEPVAQALYYTRSEDGGLTWTDAKLIAEGDIRWSQIVGIDLETLLITWQEEDNGQFSLLSRQSTNDGVEWERPSILLERSMGSDSFDLITQLPDNPYLVQVQSDQNSELDLQERVWNDNSWETVESHDFDTHLKNESLLDLTGTITGDGRLVAIFNTSKLLQDGLLAGSDETVGIQPGGQRLEVVPSIVDKPKNNLYFTQRSIDLNIPYWSENRVIVEVSTPEPTSISVAEMDSSQDSNQMEIIDENQDTVDAEGITSISEQPTSDVTRILFGLIPVILIILIVFAIITRRALLNR